MYVSKTLGCDNSSDVRNQIFSKCKDNWFFMATQKLRKGIHMKIINCWLKTPWDTGDPRIPWFHNSWSPLFRDSVLGLISWFWRKNQNFFFRKCFWIFFFFLLFLVFCLYTVIVIWWILRFPCWHDNYKKLIKNVDLEILFE